MGKCSICVCERVPEKVCMWLCVHAWDHVPECVYTLGVYTGLSWPLALFSRCLWHISCFWPGEERHVLTLGGEAVWPPLLCCRPPHPQVPLLVPTHPLSWGLCIQTGALHPHSPASTSAPCWLPQAPRPDFFEFPPIFLNHL